MFDITDVRIKVSSPRSFGPDRSERLLGFATIVLDGAFLVGDIKVIESDRGLFCSMPSRRVMDRCAACHRKNPLLANYCNECGSSLGAADPDLDRRGRPMLHADIAHPLTNECREAIETAVIHEYHEELHRSRLPGYRCRYEQHGEPDERCEAVGTSDGFAGRMSDRVVTACSRCGGAGRVCEGHGDYDACGRCDGTGRMPARKASRSSTLDVDDLMVSMASTFEVPREEQP